MDTLDRTAGAIRGRAARVVHIINAEMENYEPGVYTERVLESIKLLSETGGWRPERKQFDGGVEGGAPSVHRHAWINA